MAVLLIRPAFLGPNGFGPESARAAEQCTCSRAAERCTSREFKEESRYLAQLSYFTNITGIFHRSKTHILTIFIIFIIFIINNFIIFFFLVAQGGWGQAPWPSIGRPPLVTALKDRASNAIYITNLFIHHTRK